MHTRRQNRLCLSVLSVMVIGLVGIQHPHEGRYLPGIYQAEPEGLAREQEEEVEEPPPSEDCHGGSWFCHQVRPGDTLWAIGFAYGVPASTLASVNGLDDPNVLRPGQTLLVPSSQGRWHHVQPGDSLWRIAASYNTSVDALVLENGIRSPDRLQVGDIIAIPETGGSDMATPLAVVQPSPAGLPGLRWPLPVRGRLTSLFGHRLSGFHTGLDIAAPSGTRVNAVAAGVVSLAVYHGNYGLTVIIDHGDGIETLYAHLSRIEVSRGQRMVAGGVVGLVGSTGRSTGPHLHFELRLHGDPIDPMPALAVPD